MHSPNWFRRMLLPTAVLAMGLLLAGCGIFSPDETQDDDGNDGGTFVVPTTPDLAMENFKNSWEAMNIAEYTKLLHTGFEFYFDPADLEQGLDRVWSRELEVASVTAMFSNQPGQDPITEEPIPPIQNINFDIFNQLDPGWQNPPDQPLYEGTLRMRYRVSITVSYQGGTNSTRVSGVNYFYVTNIGGTGDDARWQIKVWEDQATVDAGN